MSFWNWFTPNSSDPSGPCSENVVGQYFAGNYLLCAQKNSLIDQGKAQIQAVADATAKNQGATSLAAQVTQQVASLEESSVTGDVNSISASDASTCDGIDLSLFGGPCVKWTYVEWAGVGFLFLVALYLFAVFNSFVPKGR